MHPSRSSGSVPATSPARSESSPKKKKVFTVARPFPSPLDFVPTHDASAVDERKAALKAQVRRDCQGKVKLHSALGTQDDVEHFSEYLTAPIQGGAKGIRSGLKRIGSNTGLGRGPSAKSLLGNETSRSRASTDTSNYNNNNNNNNASWSSLPATTLMSPTESSPAATVQRTQLIEYKKKLRQMPIHERIAMAREKNVLLIWEKRNREWEQFKTKISQKLHKAQDDLVMSKAGEYRQQMEEYDLINKATPQVEKHGNDYWTVSLRDEGTRFVPVGNVFSGLFCPIKEDKKPYSETIRRPFDHHRNEQTARKANDPLALRKRQLRKNIQAIRPHVIDSHHCQGLKVESRDLLEWASSSSQHYYDALLSLERSQPASVATLYQETPNLSRANSQLARVPTGRAPLTHRIDGPCIQFLSHLAGDPIPDEVALAFHTPIRAVQSLPVYIANPSTYTVQFRWAQYGPSHRDFAPKAAGLSPRTFVSHAQGFLLPGEVRTLHFGFASAVPGVFLERWKISIDPSLPDNNTVLYASEHAVHLTCVAIDNRAPVHTRALMEIAMNKRAVPYMVETLLRELLGQIEYPNKIQVDHDAEATRAAFEATNARFCAHYDPELYGQMHLLYERAQNLVVADAQAKLLTPANDATSPRTTMAPPLDPMAWDGAFPTLRAMAKAADVISEAAAIAIVAEEAARKAASGEDDDDDDDDENKPSTPVYKPVFQITCCELELLSQFRPHDGVFLQAQLTDHFAGLCSEIPVVSSILQHDQSGDAFYDELYSQGRAFLAQAVDESVAATMAQEIDQIASALQRDKLWLTSVATAYPAPSPCDDRTVLLYVDLDVAHCFTVRAREPSAGDETEVGTEWGWIDGFDTFIPKKIDAVAAWLTTLCAQHEAAYDATSNVTVTFVLVSRMSHARATKEKKVKKAKRKPPLPPPDDPIPPMAPVAQKLQETIGRPVEYLCHVESLHERLHKPPLSLSPTPANPSVTPSGSPTPGTEPMTPPEVSMPPSLQLNIILMEHMEALFHPPPRVDPIVVDDAKVLKDDPKAKAPAKKGKGKDDDEKKPAPVVASPSVLSVREAPVYASDDAKMTAVYNGTYADVVSEGFRSLIDVTALDSFGGDDWKSIVALPATPFVGPALATEMRRLAPLLQPFGSFPNRVRPDGSRLVVVLGGKSLVSKLWLLDYLLEIADAIYLTGSVAVSVVRFLNASKAAQKTLSLPNEPGLTLRVLDRVRSKARRLLVPLLVPMDFLVGDGPIEPEADSEEAPSDDAPGHTTARGDDDDDEADDADEDDDDEEDEEDEDDVPKKKKKTKVPAPVVVPEVVLVNEPDEVCDLRPTLPFEGTTLHLRHQDLDEEDATGWLPLENITPDMLASAYQAVLANDGTPLPLPPTWIQRVYDVGPRSVASLLGRLRAPHDPVIVAGLPGIVECRDFQQSTSALLSVLRPKKELVIVSGSTTAHWLQQLDTDETGAKLITSASARSRNVLSYYVAGQRHPALAALQPKV